MLSSLITLRHPPETTASPEDIFSSSLGSIFTDDLQNQHGTDPDTVIVYKNCRFGGLEFRTADPDDEEQRRKFAHYLWNAGVLMGELVGGRGTEQEDGTEKELKRAWWVIEEEVQLWSVKNETVLELGAGVGLGGIMSVLAGAEQTTISDYPAPPILSAITTNISNNVPEHLRSRVAVEGHQWGEFSSPFSRSQAGYYTRILAADCLWMPQEHHNLARSMIHFLSPSPSARVFVIAGFHTGRAKIAPFFEEVIPREGLDIEEIYEMDANGARREWRAERDGGREDVTGRKKWLVVARLKRKDAEQLSS